MNILYISSNSEHSWLSEHNKKDGKNRKKGKKEKKKKMILGPVFFSLIPSIFFIYLVIFQI